MPHKLARFRTSGVVGVVAAVAGQVKPKGGFKVGREGGSVPAQPSDPGTRSCQQPRNPSIRLPLASLAGVLLRGTTHQRCGSKVKAGSAPILCVRSVSSGWLFDPPVLGEVRFHSVAEKKETLPRPVRCGCRSRRQTASQIASLRRYAPSLMRRIKAQLEQGLHPSCCPGPHP